MSRSLLKHPSCRSRLGFVAAAALLGITGASAASATETQAVDRSEPSGTGQAVGDRFSLVRVSTPSRASRDRLVELGMDIASAGPASTTVLLSSESDAVELRRAGFEWTTVVADLEERNRNARAAEARRARKLPGATGTRPAPVSQVMPDRVQTQWLPPQAVVAGASMPQAASDLPSGRVSYRTLFEVNNELRYLARTYPDRVKLFSLPHRTLQGARVWGIEVTRDVDTESGKPAMLMSGIHHAREWPTADYTMEFAWDLLLSDGSDPRVTSLLDRARVVFVPVVNPDGYVISRSLVQEFKRKNCRVTPGERPAPHECADPANFDLGVDLNRNYGAYWGGIGASPDESASNYRGTEPFSEPAIQNMRELVSSHQFTVAVNNHTPDERILRVPADENEPDPVDEAPYQALAEHLAEPPDYQPGPWDEIYYNGSGVAEQFAFYATGAFAFTPELDLGEGGFHPPYDGVIAEYPEHRETYLRALEAAVDPGTHAVVTGTAPPGATLTVANAFTMYTAPVRQADGSLGPIRTFDTDLNSSMTVPDDGEFRWHLTPSMRPSEFRSALIAGHWTLSCARRSGHVRQRVDVTVDRGEQVSVAFDRCGRNSRGRP